MEIKYSDGGKTLLYAKGIEGPFVIPNSVTRIEKFAFTDCPELTAIAIPDSVTDIDETAFFYCPNVYYNVDFKNKILKSQLGSLYSTDLKKLLRANLYPSRDFYIPAHVEVLGYPCFSSLKIRKLFIPSSVKKIEACVFVTTEISEIYINCMSPDELSISDLAFSHFFLGDFCFHKCTLYVPEGTDDKYHHHPIFCEFSHIVPTCNFPDE